MKPYMPVGSARWMRLFLMGVLCFMGWGFFLSLPGGPRKRGKGSEPGRALRIALEKNKDIQKAQEYRSMVMGRYVEERSAALPQLQLSGGYGRDRDDATKEVFRGSFRRKKRPGRRRWSLQVLYSFGKVGAAIRAARSAWQPPRIN